MSFSPLAYADSLRIGSIDFVSPDEIKVLLDIEAPDSVALNTGTPRPFPKINGYVLISSDEGYLVGQVEWITIERSQYPKRKGMLDFGLVDLPYPLRKMCLNPLGTLQYDEKDKDGDDSYIFKRGVESFPSVGDAVLLPTQKQLRSIVESGKNRRVKIGTSPLAANAEVKIDPDRLFGRHLAVLGNTGSGKSCSVAGLIRWSLEAAKKECVEGKEPNARFIVLDPNGEYAHAFNEFGNARLFSVEPSDDDIKQLQVPLWFWNSSEWSAFTQASGKTQKPVLRRALREVRAGSSVTGSNTIEERKLRLRRFLSALAIQVLGALRNGLEKTEETKFGFRLKAYEEDLNNLKQEFQEYVAEISNVITAIESTIASTIREYPPGNHYFRAFTQQQLNEIISPLADLIEILGGIVYQQGPEEDCPLPFNGADLADQLDLVAQQENVTQFVDFLTMRIRTMLSDTRIKTITGKTDGITLDGWLQDYLGKNQASNGTITVIDLSLVPAEVVHIITSVIARMSFEALQRYRRLHPQKKTLPTVLVMEEAHTFIKRYRDDSDNHDAASICCQVFEKIAREGRKFGLGLVLSSQRPSELSPTVLSQCNSFLLHRISNDRDQELVHKLVPDNLRGLLRDLPSLPSRNAILLGWTSELPLLVQMNALPENQRPKSDDPDFWDVWSNKSPREVQWKAITDDWQQVTNQTEPNESEEQNDE
jgi:DNA helicase HerA-like ATPase